MLYALLTASKTSLQKAVKEYLDKIYSDLDVLSIQEHKEEMLVEYKQNGYNCNKAMTTVLNRIEQIKIPKRCKRIYNDDENSCSHVAGFVAS